MGTDHDPPLYQYPNRPARTPDIHPLLNENERMFAVQARGIFCCRTPNNAPRDVSFSGRLFGSARAHHLRQHRFQFIDPLVPLIKRPRVDVALVG